MPRGQKGTGPYAGRGSQHEHEPCPRCGRVYNKHYLLYTHLKRCKAATDRAHAAVSSGSGQRSVA